MPSMQIVPTSSPPWGPEEFLREAQGLRTTATTREMRRGYTHEEVSAMAQSLVAHMPPTYVDLLKSGTELGGGQPVQLGGADKDQVTNEAIERARTWLLGIMSACPRTIRWKTFHRLVADAFLVANTCMDGRVLIVP